jgi:hypothetical protein
MQYLDNFLFYWNLTIYQHFIDMRDTFRDWRLESRVALNKNHMMPWKKTSNVICEKTISCFFSQFVVHIIGIASRKALKAKKFFLRLLTIAHCSFHL